MKFCALLYLANLALAANSYYVVRRGIPARAGFLPGKGSLSTGPSNRVGPPRRVTAKGASSAGGDAAKSGEGQPKPSVSVHGNGPAELLYVDKHGDNIARYVDKGESIARSSSFSKRPQAGGLVKGPPSGLVDLKVKAEGKYAGVTMEVGEGGAGYVKSVGNDAVKEQKLVPGDKVKSIGHFEKGATTEAIISRPGNAYAIAYDSKDDLEKDNPGEIWMQPKVEKPEKP